MQHHQRLAVYRWVSDSNSGRGLNFRKFAQISCCFEKMYLVRLRYPWTLVWPAIRTFVCPKDLFALDPYNLTIAQKQVADLPINRKICPKNTIVTIANSKVKTRRLKSSKK